MIKRDVYLGDKICAKSEADYLIVCGVSNWGVQALVVALSIETNKNFLYEFRN